MISGSAGRAGNAGSSSTDVSDTFGPGGHATSPSGKRRWAGRAWPSCMPWSSARLGWIRSTAASHRACKPGGPHRCPGQRLGWGQQEARRPATPASRRDAWSAAYVSFPRFVRVTPGRR